MNNKEFENFINKCIPYINEIGETFKLDFPYVKHIAQEIEKEDLFEDFLNHINEMIKEKEKTMNSIKRVYLIRKNSMNHFFYISDLIKIKAANFVYIYGWTRKDIFKSIMKQELFKEVLNNMFGTKINNECTSLFISSILNKLKEIKEMNDYIRNIIKDQIELWNEFLNDKKENIIRFNSAYFHSKGIIVKPMSITESNEGKFVICSISGEGIKKGNIVIEYNSFFDLCTEV